MTLRISLLMMKSALLLVYDNELEIRTRSTWCICGKRCYLRVRRLFTPGTLDLLTVEEQAYLGQLDMLKLSMLLIFDFYFVTVLNGKRKDHESWTDD